MNIIYIPSQWYWQVGSDKARWFSSAATAYVAQLPPRFVPTPIANEQALWDVLTAAGVPIPLSATSQVAPPLAKQVAALNAKVGIAVSAQVLA